MGPRPYTGPWMIPELLPPKPNAQSPKPLNPRPLSTTSRPQAPSHKPVFHDSAHRKPTLNHKPKTPHPTVLILHPTAFCTLHPKPSTLDRNPSTPHVPLHGQRVQGHVGAKLRSDRRGGRNRTAASSFRGTTTCRSIRGISARGCTSPRPPKSSDPPCVGGSTPSGGMLRRQRRRARCREEAGVRVPAWPEETTRMALPDLRKRL